MPRPLEEAVVVITGASSGIGRAAALQHPLDVADEQAVESFAAATVERFGRIDVWVDNSVDGGWRRRRPILRRAFLAAAAGAVAGLAGAKASMPNQRTGR